VVKEGIQAGVRAARKLRRRRRRRVLLFRFEPSHGRRRRHGTGMKKRNFFIRDDPMALYYLLFEPFFWEVFVPT